MNLLFPEGRMGEGILREFGMDIAVSKMDNQSMVIPPWMLRIPSKLDINKDILILIVQGTLLNVVWQGGWKGSSRENWYMYLYGESLCCPPETIKLLLIGYTPIQNKKFFKKIYGLILSITDAMGVPSLVVPIMIATCPSAITIRKHWENRDFITYTTHVGTHSKARCIERGRVTGLGSCFYWG